MAKHVVVVVDADSWVPRAIAAGVPADEIDVVPCTTARGGLNACCAIEPDCVIAEEALPDLDGLWLARSLREQPSAIAATPFILMAANDGEPAHLRALRGGADVFVPKPFNVVELVAQVRALIAMASRMRARHSILPGAAAPASGPERAMVGNLDRISIATVLSALELERRSGELTLSGGPAGRRRLTLEIASGALTGGRLGSMQLRPLEGLREALHWSGKRFQFMPGDAIPAPPSAESIGCLVLSAIALDEAPAQSGPPPARTPNRPPLPAGRTSGTMPRIPPPMPAKGGPPRPLPPPLGAPGHRLIETMAPAARPDPRSEQDDDGGTLKLGSRARR